LRYLAALFGWIAYATLWASMCYNQTEIQPEKITIDVEGFDLQKRIDALVFGSCHEEVVSAGIQPLCTN
jgi:hypothetical protein